MQFLNLSLFKKELPNLVERESSLGESHPLKKNPSSFSGSSDLKSSFSKLLQPKQTPASPTNKAPSMSKLGKENTAPKIADSTASKPNKEKAARDLNTVKQTLEKSTSSTEAKINRQSSDQKQAEKDYGAGNNSSAEVSSEQNKKNEIPLNASESESTTQSTQKPLKSNAKPSEIKEILGYLGGMESLVIHYPAFKVLAGEADAIPTQALGQITGTNPLLTETLSNQGPSLNALTQNGSLRTLLSKLGIPSPKLNELEKAGFDLSQPMRMDKLLIDFGFNPKAISIEIEKIKARLQAEPGIAQSLMTENLKNTPMEMPLPVNPEALKALKYTELTPALNTEFSVPRSQLSYASNLQGSSPVSEAPLSYMPLQSQDRLSYITAQNPGTSPALRSTDVSLSPMPSLGKSLGNAANFQAVPPTNPVNQFKEDASISRLTFVPRTIPDSASVPSGLSSTLANLDGSEFERFESSAPIREMAFLDGETVKEFTKTLNPILQKTDAVRADSSEFSDLYEPLQIQETPGQSLEWQKYFSEFKSAPAAPAEFRFPKRFKTESNLTAHVQLQASVDEPISTVPDVVEGQTSNKAPATGALARNLIGNVLNLNSSISQGTVTSGKDATLFANDTLRTDLNVLPTESDGDFSSSYQDDNSSPGESQHESNKSSIHANAAHIGGAKSDKGSFSEKLSMNDVYSSIAQKAKDHVPFRGGTLSLSLENSSIGPLDLEIDVSGKNVAINFGNLDKHVIELIRSDLPQLREALAQQNLSLTNTSFNAEAFTKGNFTGFSQQPQRQFQDAPLNSKTEASNSKTTPTRVSNMRRKIYPQSWRLPVGTPHMNGQLAVLV